MSKPKPLDQWLKPSEYGPCACTQLRRAARKVSALYDEALHPAGLTVTQYALLVNVARTGEVSRTALALQLGMDRTTLTRNLMPLEKLALVVPAESKDRRERLMRLSDSGQRKVRQSYRLWEKAQKTFISRIGIAAFKQFHAALKAAESAAAFSADTIGKPRMKGKNGKKQAAFETTIHLA